MSYKVERVAGSRNLGEGPHWDHNRQHLYYVDATASTIHRYIPAEGRDTYCKLDDKAIVAIIIPVEGSTDKFVVTIHNKVCIVTWDGESTTPQNIEVVTTVDEGHQDNWLNDGKVDPTGRLWVGTMRYSLTDGITPDAGALYSFPAGKPKKHFGGITIANGLAWSEDLKHMYYIDTPTKRVDVLDFDSANGTVSNRRPLIDLDSEMTDKKGGPDGMCIDTDGNLWVAMFGEGSVFHISTKEGKLIRKIDIPSKQATSVAFGGRNLDELYVVSATFGLTEEDRPKYPDAGCTFRVTGLGVKGYAGESVQF